MKLAIVGSELMVLQALSHQDSLEGIAVGQRKRLTSRGPLEAASARSHGRGLQRPQIGNQIRQFGIRNLESGHAARQTAANNGGDRLVVARRCFVIYGGCAVGAVAIATMADGAAGFERLLTRTAILRLRGNRQHCNQEKCSLQHRF